MRMKKHFLLLLLMTLLPLAGWAEKPVVSGLSGATGLRYDGQQQALITGSIGYPSGYNLNAGKIQFVVKTEQELPTDDEIAAATSTFPVKTDAKLYYVYYRLTNDGSYFGEDGDWTMVPVRINKGVPSFSTEIAGATGLFYDGTEQDLIGTLPVVTFGTVQYKLDGGDYSETAPKAINAGTYTVFYKVDGNENWEAIAEQSIEVAVNKANATVTAPTAIEGGLTYNRGAQSLVNDGSVEETGVKLKYSLEEEGEYTYDIPTATKAGDYTVYYKVDEANYSSEVGHVDVSIARKSLGTDGVAAEGFTFAVNSPNRTFKAANWTFVSSQLTRKDGENDLINNTDFELTYGNNFNATPENPTDEQKPYVLFTGKGNYTGTAKAYFNIAQLDITENAEVTIQAIEDKPYKAAQIKPNELTVKYGSHSMTEATDAEAAGDYYLTYGDNLNVNDGGTVTVNGKGNYKGTKAVNFNITKATLTVTADSKEKYFGSADPATTYTLTGFLGTTDNKDNINLSGEPTITRENGEDVGSYDYSLDVNNLESYNYAFVAAAEQGSLTIKAATAIVTPTAIEAQTYGYTLPNPLDKNAFAFTTSGLKAGVSITSMDYTVINAETEEVQAAGAMLPVGTYTVIPSNAVCDGGYTITYNNVTLTVNPKEIKIVAQNQELDFANPTPALDKNTDPDGESNYQSWKNDCIKMFDSNENTILKSEFVAKYGVWKEAFVESLTWEEHDGTVANPGIIKVNLKDGISANFNVTTVNGTVTYTNVPDELILTGDADDLAKINTFANQTVDVTIDFTARNGRNLGGERNWVKENWVTLTLPFDISVAELSQKLGYAIVNVIDPSKTKVNGTSSEFYGKLTMKGGNGSDEVLMANKPFTVKIADDIVNRTGGVINFGSRLIVAPTDLTVDAGQGAKFVGTYSPKTVSKDNGAENIWFLIGGGYTKWAYIMSTSSASWTIAPFEAYIDMSNLSAEASRNMTFYFEDIDGTITAIKSINVDDMNQKLSPEGWYNLNGVKLQGAPTEKGVYIKDGKKFVIK